MKTFWCIWGTTFIITGGGMAECLDKAQETKDKQSVLCWQPHWADICCQ